MKAPENLTNSIRQQRRSFIKQSIIAGSGVVALPALMQCSSSQSSDLILEPNQIIGMKKIDGEQFLENASWFSGEHVKDGFHYTFPVGSLSDKKFITTDMLADGKTLIQFNIELQEGENGPTFQFAFGVLNQCSLRVRLPLYLVDQNTWRMPRDGAFLKPMCWGDRVDLNKVDRMRFYINRKSTEVAQFCLTSMIATNKEVPVIQHPVLPKGKLLDQIGQSTLHDWKGKTRNVEAMISSLRNQHENANHSLPAHFSRWGGCKAKRIDNGSGFFRVIREDDRWWLTDPDGYLFWSAGIDSVRVDTSGNVNLLEDALEFLPQRNGEYEAVFSEQQGQLHVNYLAANFIRAFGKDGWRDKWAKITIDQLKRLCFNTVGNWSEWGYASKASFPYVRPMHFSAQRTKNIFRDFPDVYHPDFAKDARDYAQVLSNSVDDPALIGYFMMNEPTWAFANELPAVGMLYNSSECETRTEFVRILKEKYESDEKLSASWGVNVSFEKIKKGKWKREFTSTAIKDLESFSEAMVKKYFGDLSDACRRVDPNHLNLGIRYQGVPPHWAVAGMKSFDVFSMNNYREKVPLQESKEIHDLLQMPIVIGEWHFGALDVGLPASGIGHVKTQEDRGKAYRVYFEDAAANPYCVGVHWFVLYDQSALGRFDGENYNIGFMDICNQPHEPICDAALLSHQSMYDVADGSKKPYNKAPEYLPKLFL